MLFKSAYLGNNEIVKAYKGNILFYEKSGGDLPSGYTKLAWIAGNGQDSARFEIPCDFDSTKILRVVGAIPSTASQNGVFVYKSLLRKGGVHLRQTSGKIAFLYGDTWQQTSITPVVSQIYDTEYSVNGGWVDSVKQVNGIATDFGVTNYITNAWYYNKWYGSIHRIYLVQVKDSNGNVLINAVPVLDGNGEPCMYDTINKTTYGKVGTGSFTYSLT